MPYKLKLLNRLRPRFQLELDSNNLLIDFFYPNCRDETDFIGPDFYWKVEKEIDIDQKSWFMSTFLIKFDFFYLLIDIKVTFLIKFDLFLIFKSKSDQI